VCGIELQSRRVRRIVVRAISSMQSLRWPGMTVILIAMMLRPEDNVLPSFLRSHLARPEALRQESRALTLARQQSPRPRLRVALRSAIFIAIMLRPEKNVLPSFLRRQESRALTLARQQSPLPGFRVALRSTIFIAMMLRPEDNVLPSFPRRRESSYGICLHSISLYLAG